jgi:quercetin dioxygenase-like cupin family protein
MTTFDELGALWPLPVWPGVIARTVEGKEMTLAVVELDPDAVVAEHHHPNEQLGIVLSGSMTFTIGGETREIVAGDTYVIPADVPHTATAGPEGSVVIDVFAPVRSDWKAFEPREPTTPRWP